MVENVGWVLTALLAAVGIIVLVASLVYLARDWWREARRPRPKMIECPACDGVGVVRKVIAPSFQYVSRCLLCGGRREIPEESVSPKQKEASR